MQSRRNPSEERGDFKMSENNILSSMQSEKEEVKESGSIKGGAGSSSFGGL